MGKFMKLFRLQTLQFKFGLVILVLILSMVTMPWLFTRTNPYGTEPMKTASDPAGHFIIHKAPFPPQQGLLLGTDEIGRPIWPLIVYGTKLTMTLALGVVLARFAVSVPMGFAAGFGSLVAKSSIRQFSLLFGALPALMFSIMLLKMPFFMNLDKQASMWAFIGLLTLVGWGRLALVIEDRVENLLAEPFVQGEIVLGKNKFEIATTCLMRHLAPELCVLLFLETARALTLLLQLGLFSIFVGNVRFIEDVFKGKPIFMNLSYEPEWAGMLGSARNNIRVAPWIILFPSLAFFISVLGLNAFGEGLRQVFQANVQTEKIRCDMKKHKKSIAAIAIGLVFMVILGAAIPYYADETRFKLPLSNGKIENLAFEQAPVVAGTANGKKASEWIVELMKKNGLKPLQTSYVSSYDLPNAYYPKSQNVEINIGSQNKYKLVPGKDYQLMSYGQFDEASSFVDCTTVDLYNEALASKSLSKKGFILLDATQYERKAIMYFNEKYSKLPQVKGLIWLTDMKQLRDQQMGDVSLKVPTLFLDWSWMSKMTQANAALNLRETYEKADGRGYNLSGYLPAENTNVGNTYLVYGFSYNALTPEESIKKVEFAFSFIEALKKDPHNRNRSIIVTFFDGTLSDRLNGMMPYVEALPFESKMAVLFCDMTRIAGLEQGDFIYSENQSPISHYYAYTFALQFKQRFEKEHLNPLMPVDVVEEDYPLYLKKGIPTLIFGLKQRNSSLGAEQPDEHEITLERLGKILTSVISHNNY